MTNSAFQFETTVGPDGKLVLAPEADKFGDLVEAAAGSTAFWDNPLDDEDWNMPSQGDIALVPVPFTDLSSVRRRPVIVISNDTYNTATLDMVVVAMTSNPIPTAHGFTAPARFASTRLMHYLKARS